MFNKFNPEPLPPEHVLTAELIKAVRTANWGTVAEFIEEDRWSRDLVTAELEKTCSSLEEKYKGYVSGGAWEQEYNNWQKNYLIHKPHDVRHRKCHFCTYNIRGVVEDAIHILLAVSPNKAKEEIMDQYLSDRRRFPHVRSDDLRRLWKTRTGLIKMAGPQYSPYWRYLVYWETFWGYQPYKQANDLDSEISKWLCNRHIAGENVGINLYEKLIRHKTQRWLRSNWKGPKQYEWKVVKEWVEEGVWA